MAYAAKKLSKSTSGSAKLYAQGLSQAAARFQGKEVDQRSGLQLLQTLIGAGQSSSHNTPSIEGNILGSLVGDLMSGEEAQQNSSAASGDMLGALLGSLAGGGESSQGGSSASSDMLSALLGGTTGSGEAQQSGSAAGSDMLSTILGGMTENAETQQSGSAAGGDMLSTLLGGLTGGSSSSAGLQDMLDLGDLLSVGMAYMQFKQQGNSNLEAFVNAFMQTSGMGRSADRTQSTEIVINSFLKALGVES